VIVTPHLRASTVEAREAQHQRADVAGRVPDGVVPVAPPPAIQASWRRGAVGGGAQDWGTGVGGGLSGDGERERKMKRFFLLLT
jgi:hypothetical protein